MSKWYHPFGLLLLAAMVGDLSGCAQTSGWLAKKPLKKSKEKDEEIAATTKKSRDKDKSAKAKSSKELVDAKSTKTKDDPTAKTTDPKVVDKEHEKYAAAERQKSKVRTKSATAKGEAKLETSAIAKTDGPSPKKKAPVVDSQDDLDSFAKKIEPTTRVAKSAAASDSMSDDFQPFDDSPPVATKRVVQVKKDESDVAANLDLDDEKSETNAKPVRVASAAESFEDELEIPTVTAVKTEKVKPSSSESDWDDELPDSKPEITMKSGAKKETGQGMASFCPNADGELRELLKSMDPGDFESLRHGLHRIGQLNKGGAAAAPLLRKMLKHEDAFVRAHAVLAMVRLGIVAPESAEIVTDSLKSRDASLRSFGAAVLSEMGPESKEVLASLSESLKDREGQIRIRAAEVLIQYEDWAYPALQSLLVCLKDKDENVRWLAVYSLAELAPENPEAVQALMKAVHDPVPKVRAGAAYALGEIGPFAKRSSSELRRVLESTDDEDLKNAITYSLKQMEKESH